MAEPPLQPPTEAAQKLFDRAEKARSLGQLTEAARLYESYLQQYPETTLSDDALFRAAQVNGELEFTDRAMEQYQSLLERFPSSEWSAEASLSLGQLYIELGREEEGIETLRRLIGRRLTRGHQLQVSLWLGRAYEEEKNYLSAARWLGKAWELESDSEIRSKIRKKLSDWMMERFTIEELEGLVKSFPRSYPGSEARYRLALLLMRDGKTDLAKEHLEEIIHWEFDEEMKARAYLLLSRLELQSDVGTRQIGALLPLTGKYASYGAQVLRGMELAVGLYGKGSPSAAGLQIILYNTEGDPEKARRGVKWLSSKGVVAIVGPITSGEVEAVSDVATEIEIPVFSFSQRSRPSIDTDYVFRLSPSYEDQVVALLRYAMDDLELKQFGLLYPDDPYGHEWASLVRQGVEARGGVVTTEASYTPSSTEISAAIQRLIELPEGYEPPEERGEGEAVEIVEIREGEEGTGEDEKKEEIIIPFQALFIPDYYKNVALVVPQLAYHDVRGVQLLGTSAWNSPELLELADRSLEGAVFPAAFFQSSPIPRMRSFEKEYSSVFWEKPDNLAALGYDIVQWLDSSLAKRKVASGFKLREILIEGHRFQGVTGESYFLPNGELVKEVRLVRVERGRMVPILY